MFKNEYCITIRENPIKIELIHIFSGTILCIQKGNVKKA